MSHRGLSLFLIMVLCLVVLPFGNTAVAATKGEPQAQNPALEIGPIDDGNPYTYEFSGGYSAGGQYVGLDAYSVKSNPYYVPTSDGGWEEQVDYLYTDSDMSKSDGSALSYSVRELDRSAGQNMLYITLNGVTLPFDLNAQDKARFLTLT